MSKNMKPKDQMKTALLICALTSMSPAFANGTMVKADNLNQHIGKGGISGLPVGKAVDIDKEITISMPKSSVFVFEGIDKGNFDFGEAN